jgi:tRNA uridine 5-carboxymethylaminomethyl modification enzyme
MVSFFRDAANVGEANPILARYCFNPHKDKMFKIFSRLQITLEDIMKFDKAKPLKKMMWTKNEQAES